MVLPALRNLDVSPVEHEGQTLICFRDPEGFVEGQVVLTPFAFFVASYLDGTTSVLDIQHAFAREFDGALLMSDNVLKVVKYLDDQGFLLTDRFESIRARVETDFANTPVRPGYLAGQSYPADPGELRAFLEAFFPQTAESDPPARTGGSAAPLRALIVPHIDFQRGGPTYGHGYQRMRRGGKPDTAIIFGVAHALAPAPFTLTKKHFQTPFGALETAPDLVDRLAAACAWDPYEHEIVHRTEHSIEFQAVMLAHLYGTGVRIVPILCGPLTDDPQGIHPESVEGVQAFLAACREIAASSQDRVTVIAGADLAHVGRRFGDPFDITPSVVRRVERRDREDLAYVTALDPEGFYRSVIKDGNSRKVCGLGCIYAALKTVQGSAGAAGLLDYACAPDPAGGMVSFAAIALSAKTSQAP